MDSLSLEASNRVVENALRLAEAGHTERKINTDLVESRCARVDSSGSTDVQLSGSEEKIAMFKELLGDLKQGHSVRPYIEINHIEQMNEERICNSLRTDICSKVLRTYVLLRAFAHRGGKLASGTAYFATSRGVESATSLSGGQFGRDAVKIAEEQLGAKQLKPGRYPVVLDPQLSAVFVHEAVGHQLEGDMVLRSQSVLGDSPRAVAPETLSVYDDPTVNGSFAWYPFDSEGLPGRRTHLIRNGTLGSFLHNIETASSLKGSPGNARAQNHQVEPLPRLSTVCIVRGDYNEDELVEEMGDGLLLRGVGPVSDINTATGEIRLRAQTGRLVRSKRVEGPVNACMLYGQTSEVLRSVKAVGDNWNLAAPGFCVKGGQTIPTEGGSPSIMIGEVRISS